MSLRRALLTFALWSDSALGAAGQIREVARHGVMDADHVHRGGVGGASALAVAGRTQIIPYFVPHPHVASVLELLALPVVLLGARGYVRRASLAGGLVEV